MARRFPHLRGAVLFRDDGAEKTAEVVFVYKGDRSAAPWPDGATEWIALKDEQAAIRTELTTQRTNCLNTLQMQGVEQIKLLGKAVDVLDGVRLDLREQTTILRLFPQPRARKAAAKK